MKRCPAFTFSPDTAKLNSLSCPNGPLRELVSRDLSRFQAEGTLKFDGRNVTDIKALEAELQSGK